MKLFVLLVQQPANTRQLNSSTTRFLVQQPESTGQLNRSSTKRLLVQKSQAQRNKTAPQQDSSHDCQQTQSSIYNSAATRRHVQQPANGGPSISSTKRLLVHQSKQSSISTADVQQSVNKRSETAPQHESSYKKTAKIVQENCSTTQFLVRL